MQEEINKVREFHQLFALPVLDKPRVPEDNRIDLRFDLIREEAEEFLRAAYNKDIVEVADALTDILYVTFGAALEFGLQDKLVECFKAVHENNLSKLGADGKPIYRADGKVKKPDGYKPVDLTKIVNE